MQGECPTKERAGELRRAVKDAYRAVADRPEGRFPYPIGRASAAGLGYEAAWLDAVPRDVLARFVGVGNPFVVRRPSPGERVLDLGCGSGTDVFVAGLLVGPRGRAAGVDLAPEMLEWARRSPGGPPPGNLEFVEGDVEDLPFEDGSFDLAVSNGVLNLVPDKERAFREIHRVLRPGGAFAAADLLVTETIPREVLEDMAAWST